MPPVPAMYSVEITVEKDKVTGETRVLSSTTLLPREPLPQGIKVYEDETKGMRPPSPTPGPHPTPFRSPPELTWVLLGERSHPPQPTVDLEAVQYWACSPVFVHSRNLTGSLAEGWVLGWALGIESQRDAALS